MLLEFSKKKKNSSGITQVEYLFCISVIVGLFCVGPGVIGYKTGAGKEHYQITDGDLPKRGRQDERSPTGDNPPIKCLFTKKSGTGQRGDLQNCDMNFYGKPIVSEFCDLYQADYLRWRKSQLSRKVSEIY